MLLYMGSIFSQFYIFKRFQYESLEKNNLNQPLLNKVTKNFNDSIMFLNKDDIINLNFSDFSDNLSD